jgi:predicted nuclease of predicted toxin-antitoxin system
LKLLIDQMWPVTLATELRDRGHDAIAVVERPELVHCADEIVFGAGRADERAIFTENVPDYLQLARECLSRGDDFHGLLLTSNARYPRGHPRTLGRAVRALDAFLGERPGERDLLNQIAWLPAPPG